MVDPTIWIGCFHRKHWVPGVENDPEGKRFYRTKYRYLSADKKTQRLIVHESVHWAIENVESLEASAAYEAVEKKVWNRFGTMV